MSLFIYCLFFCFFLLFCSQKRFFKYVSGIIVCLQKKQNRYSCDSSSFTITTYSDSNCSIMTNSTRYTSCYYIGTADTDIGTFDAYLAPDTCTSADETTMGPIASTTTGMTGVTTTLRDKISTTPIQKWI